MWVCCVLCDRPVHAGAKGKSAGHNVDMGDVRGSGRTRTIPQKGRALARDTSPSGSRLQPRGPSKASAFGGKTSN